MFMEQRRRSYMFMKQIRGLCMFNKQIRGFRYIFLKQSRGSYLFMNQIRGKAAYWKNTLLNLFAIHLGSPKRNKICLWVSDKARLKQVSSATETT